MKSPKKMAPRQRKPGAKQNDNSILRFAPSDVHAHCPCRQWQEKSINFLRNRCFLDPDSMMHLERVEENFLSGELTYGDAFVLIFLAVSYGDWSCPEEILADEAEGYL